MGLGAYPASGDKWLGMLGMHGLYEANMAMHGCDLMINVGARFDDRITGMLGAFSPKSTKVHIDIDPSSINKVVQADVPILGDVAHVLEDGAGAVEVARSADQFRRPRRSGGAASKAGARPTACASGSPARRSSRSTRSPGWRR